MQSKLGVLFFEPEMKYLVWGNESWTISAHAHGDVKVGGGIFAGKTLSRLWAEQPELFGLSRAGDAAVLQSRSRDDSSSVFPLLVKIITANDDLSIQVHPDDAYSALHENGSLGKTECWYILDCEADAKLVLGHNAKNKAELAEMVESGQFTELIREVPVKQGDFIQMNPGTVHAIKGGIRLLEIQQSSDITYRLYDYGRTVDGKPRELHLKKALDVIGCPAPAASDSIITAKERAVNQLNELISCDYYKIWELSVSGQTTIIQNHPFLIVCVIAGEGEIGDEIIRADDHFILPYGCGEVSFRGEMRLILASGS